MSALQERIELAVSSKEPEALRGAVGLAGVLLAENPGEDRIAKLAFEVAFQAEVLEDDPLCADLYRKIVAYEVLDENIRAGAYFRLGCCAERTRSWREAIQCFREALRLGKDWRHMTDHAAMHLAKLLHAAEEFGAAEQLFEQLADSPISEIPRDAMRLSRARCLIQLGNLDVARAELESARTNSALAVEAEHLLANLYESAGNKTAAIYCYQRLIDHPDAETAVKAAAAYRIEQLH